MTDHPHPGEFLRLEFLPQYGLTAGSLAKAMGLKNRSPIERLVREDQSITPALALRLGKVFGASAQFWMNLQTAYDLAQAREILGDSLEHILPVRPPTGWPSAGEAPPLPAPTAAASQSPR